MYQIRSCSFQHCWNELCHDVYMSRILGLSCIFPKMLLCAFLKKHFMLRRIVFKLFPMNLMKLVHEMLIWFYSYIKWAYALQAPICNLTLILNERGSPFNIIGTSFVAMCTCRGPRSFQQSVQSIIDSIHKINDNLRQSRRPSCLTLPSDGFTSPSVHKIADFKPTFTTIKQATRVSANLRRPAPVYENYKSLSCNSIIS